MKNNKPITEEQVAEFQEYLDKLSIFDLDMVNRIVFYKRQEALKEVLELVEKDQDDDGFSNAEYLMDSIKELMEIEK